MLSYKEALKIILSYSRSFGTEKISISSELNRRVLAETILADRDYPPFNRSTMDGFALRFADIEAGITQYRVIETVLAGRLSTKLLGQAECYKIMTGALVPADADMVIKIEDAEITGNTVRFKAQNYAYNQSIARQGEDISKGEIYIEPGLMYNSTIAGSLAVVGKTAVVLQKLPRVALFSSGDELVSVSSTPEQHQIRNSNSPMLASMLFEYAIKPASTVHLPDDPAVISAAITAASDCDILILSGAVSAGDADYIPSTLKSLGYQEILHKIGIKPGKPIWFGMKPDGPIVFALPGNPLSSQVTFKLFVEPFLRCCFGLPELVPVLVPFLGGRIKKVPFDEFFPVYITAVPYGLKATVSHTSGDIRSVVNSSGIAWHQASATELVTGDLVSYFCW